MNLWDRLFKAPKEMRPNLSAGVFTPGTPIYSEMTVKNAVRNGYNISIWVNQATRIIVQACSAVPFYAEVNSEAKLDHPLSILLDRPNPQFSGQDMMELNIAHQLLCGNHLWQPLMVNGLPKEIWPVMPDLVQPITGTQGRWLDGWQVTLPDGGMKDFPVETFIHFMQLNPGNPYWGTGRLMAAARTVDTDNEAQDTQKVSMQNRMMPSGILTPTDTELDQDDLDRFKEKFKDEYSSKEKRRAPWFFNKAMKWEAMSLTPVEMDFIASRLQNLRAIAAAFGISPIFLGDLDQSSYNNMAEARHSLYQDVCIPMLDDIKATLNLRLAPMYGDNVTVNYDLSNVAALREDFGKKVLSAQTLFSMGVPFDQINDQLGLGFDEFPGWNRSYLPFSLAPNSEPIKSTRPLLLKKYRVESEEQKTRQWQRLDSRRVGWWSVVGSQMKSMYQRTGDVAIQGVHNIDAAIDSTSKEWEKKLTASYLAVIEDFGKETTNDFKKGPVFDPFTEAIKLWIKLHAADSVKTILATNKDALKGILQAGMDEGLSIYDISEQIRQFYADNSQWMAERVARTEVGKAASYGSRAAAEQSGVVATHRWLTARDSSVRDSHSMIDGEERPLNDVYSNGLLYPGDPSGDPGEVINCRCVELFGTGD